jgi:hypothetical protein
MAYKSVWLFAEITGEIKNPPRYAGDFRFSQSVNSDATSRQIVAGAPTSVVPASGCFSRLPSSHDST